MPAEFWANLSNSNKELRPMLLRVIIAIICVYLAWAVTDVLIHGIMLRPVYEESKELWRPEEEFKMPLLQSVVFLSGLIFVAIYALLINPKCMKTGLAFGGLTGLSVGLSMGYGTYAVQPVPYELPLTWFLGSIAQGIIAGAIAAALVKGPPKAFDG